MEHYGVNTQSHPPVITGTTVTVEAVLQELAHHASFDKLLTTHPELTRDAICEALLFAAARLHEAAPQAAEVSVPQEATTFTPSTPFGREMWELHQSIVTGAPEDRKSVV